MPPPPVPTNLKTVTEHYPNERAKVLCCDFALMDRPGAGKIHFPEMRFSDLATAHLSGVVTYKYGDTRNITT
jgi:hypothetical protein